MIKKVKIKNYRSLVDFEATFNDNDNLITQIAIATCPLFQNKSLSHL